MLFRSKFNWLDTPGSGVFITEAKAALEVVEGALVLVDAAAGLAVMTEKVWEFADEYHVPRMIIVNKMDRENASFDKVLAGLRERFGKRCVPLLIPMGEGPAFSGVINLVRMKAAMAPRICAGPIFFSALAHSTGSSSPDLMPSRSPLWNCSSLNSPDSRY